MVPAIRVLGKDFGTITLVLRNRYSPQTTTDDENTRVSLGSAILIHLVPVYLYPITFAVFSLQFFPLVANSTCKQL